MLNDSHLRLIPIQSHFAETRELALEKLAAKKADGRVVTWGSQFDGNDSTGVNDQLIRL